MAGMETSRNVNAREAVDDIRGPLTNGELMEKFKITPAGYADLLKQLYMKKLITEEDLTRRGIRFRIVKPQEEEKPVVQVPVMPPQPLPEDAEFLDTVTLTELLAFKPQEPPPKKEEKEPPPPPDAEDDPAPKQKKSKFSISGLFKKTT